MRGFLVNLLHDRICSKIFRAFQGYERIAMMGFPLVKKFQPLSVPVTKIQLQWFTWCASSQASSSPVIHLFPEGIAFTFPTAKAKTVTLCSLSSNQTWSSFSYKILASHFPLSPFLLFCLDQTNEWNLAPCWPPRQDPKLRVLREVPLRISVQKALFYSLPHHCKQRAELPSYNNISAPLVPRFQWSIGWSIPENPPLLRPLQWLLFSSIIMMFPFREVKPSVFTLCHSHEQSWLIWTSGKDLVLLHFWYLLLILSSSPKAAWRHLTF